MFENENNQQQADNTQLDTQKRRTLVSLAAVGTTGILAGCMNDNDSETESETPYSIEDQPSDATTEFVSPENGDTVTSPVQIEATVENVELVAASEPAAVGEGHLHVNVDVGCLQSGTRVPGPSDAAEEQGYYHLSDGSSEGELELESGEHDLCLQLGDSKHAVFGETETITITVEN